MRRLCGTLCLLLVPQLLVGQRSVAGNRLTSAAHPTATLVIAPEFQYAGTQTFDVNGVATAEQHVFVQLDGNRIRRAVWILFEGYHPSNALTYAYRDSTIQHSGQTWHHRVVPFRMAASETQPETTGGRFRTFLRSRGWHLGPDIVLEQFTWLVDSPARHELIVTYIEDLADAGTTAADASEGGRSRTEWQELVKRIHQRGTAAFSVVDYRP